MSDVHAADLPGNSIVAEVFERNWRAHNEAVRNEARNDLIARCALPGAARRGYLEYCREIHICNIQQYVDMLERIDAKIWQQTYHLWMRASIENGKEPA